MTAAAFLSAILSDPRRLTGCARQTHEAYLAGLTKKLEDPSNPFQGFPEPGTVVELRDGSYLTLTGTERIKVEALSPVQRNAFNIAADADPKADVFHYNFRPFDDLSPEVKAQNIGPMLAVVEVLAASLWDGADLAALRSLVGSLLSPADGPRGATTIAILERINWANHLAWSAAQVRGGVTQHPDFRTYRTLGRDIQALDTYTTVPALQYLLREIRAAMAAEREVVAPRHPSGSDS